MSFRKRWPKQELYIKLDVNAAMLHVTHMIHDPHFPGPRELYVSAIAAAPTADLAAIMGCQQQKQTYSLGLNTSILVSFTSYNNFLSHFSSSATPSTLPCPPQEESLTVWKHLAEEQRQGCLFLPSSKTGTKQFAWCKFCTFSSAPCTYSEFVCW